MKGGINEAGREAYTKTFIEKQYMLNQPQQIGAVL